MVLDYLRMHVHHIVRDTGSTALAHGLGCLRLLLLRALCRRRFGCFAGCLSPSAYTAF